MTYLWAALLLIANIAAWAATLFTLPGNWLILLLTALYAFFLPEDAHPRVSWTVVGIAFGLAVLGEVIEFVAGAAGAAKEGGSRRGAAFAIVGAVIGSLVGATLAMPIPIIGPLIGALGGGALGAFAGAYLGEESIRTHTERMEIGRGAMIGRLLGTAGKLIVGALMVIIIAIDSFLDLPRQPDAVDHKAREPLKPASVARLHVAPVEGGQEAPVRCRTNCRFAATICRQSEFTRPQSARLTARRLHPR